LAVLQKDGSVSVFATDCIAAGWKCACEQLRKLLAQMSGRARRSVKKFSVIVTFCFMPIVFYSAAAQEFEINGQSNASSRNAPASKKAGAQSAAPQSGGIGWGSSIEVSRAARAAEDALKRGNYAAAVDFAARATNLAPQDASLWFLLGYTSRMAGRYQTSLDAFERGLKARPNSIEGLSGLAQTYMRMGRTDEAKKLLTRVIAADPKNAVDLQMAGELFMRSGDLNQASTLLARAEAIQSSPHTEVLLAITCMKLKQPERAKALLERAKARGRNPEVFRAVAQFYRESGDYKSAIEVLKQIPESTPDALAELGYTYQLAGDKNDAANTYINAANAAPAQINLQLSAAEALIHAGKSDLATAYLSRAAAIDPNHYRLHAIRADLARTDGRSDDAIREFNAAIANLPPAGVPEGTLYPIQLHLSLSEQYRNIGDQADARQQVALAESQLDQLNIQGPARAEFLRMRAAIESTGEEYEKAEADLKEARTIDPGNVITTIQYGSLLWRMKRFDEARAMYDEALKIDPRNRYAVESLGYIARDQGNNDAAQRYFEHLASIYPNDYVAYLALGDLYTAEKNFLKALASYEEAYKFAPDNPLVISGGANAAIESRQIALAGQWVERAKGAAADDPHVLIERERYLFHVGKYADSAVAGEKALKQLTGQRDGAVYLAYDYYNLGRYDDVLRLVRQYERILPHEPNFPLLAGHVERQTQLFDLAIDDYTRALADDSTMPAIYVNRGYTYNELQDAQAAADDFHHALQLQPDNGVAHLGLAFSYLELRRGKEALDETDAAQKLLGESGSTHLARATAYRQMRLLRDAAKEYEIALKYAPDDLTLHLALADTLYHLRQYNQAIAALNDSLALSPDNPVIYAELAHSYAQLHRRDETMRYVAAAERQGSDQSGVLLATGDALMTLGDNQAAMQRFERALDAPDADRVSARLLIAQLFARESHWNDARQQIALAFAESRIGEAPPVTAENLIVAANLFLAMHDFNLAVRYFEKAHQAGAADQVVAIGLANTYLAQGDTSQAQAELASLGTSSQLGKDYDYTMAMGSVYQQRHENALALNAYAQASQIAADDDVSANLAEETAGQEGLRLNDKVSVATDLTISPIYQDATIYMLNAILLGASGPTLPPPASSIQTQWTNSFKVHEQGWPLISGFFQIRNAQGSFLIPSELLTVRRDTTDYNTNGALNPVLHLGRATMQFNTGLQFTIRRDSLDPVDMDQNLFRQFLFMSTNSIGNWLSIRGSAIHEAGPFTLQNLTSSEYYGSVEFTLGRPWGKTALITGWNALDLKFNGTPPFREFYETFTYAGLHRSFFNRKLQADLLAGLIRSWRVQGLAYAYAKATAPGVRLNYRFNPRWEANAMFTYSSASPIPAYDNTDGGVFISYIKPLHRAWNDGNGDLSLSYPLRFSVGFEQQTFPQFFGGSRATYRPVIRLALF
jgi:tetratricopeptide (TPR) repeat protein